LWARAPPAKFDDAWNKILATRARAIGRESFLAVGIGGTAIPIQDP
jgi:hypothetical protein